MDYNTLVDLATDLGYELAMSGAETFRVEESINRVLASYGIVSEVFAIPNCLTVSMETDDGQILTRMRRIGSHGNDLDSVERFNGLSRAICNRKPDPIEGKRWLDIVRQSRMHYSFPVYLLGNFLGAAGFSVFFGGNWLDCIFGGICGVLIGLVTRFLENMKANPFFRTIAAAFSMAFLAYLMGAAQICRNADMVIIGALMILVPGLLFTNAMRDIIYGDTTSGVNRIVQVFLTAVALALGTAAAWRVVSGLLGEPVNTAALAHNAFTQCLFCLGRTHGQHGDGSAAAFLQLQGGFNSGLVIGVDDGGHAVTLQGIGHGIDLDLGGVGDLLDTNNDFHSVHLTSSAVRRR